MISKQKSRRPKCLAISTWAVCKARRDREALVHLLRQALFISSEELGASESDGTFCEIARVGDDALCLCLAVVDTLVNRRLEAALRLLKDQTGMEITTCICAGWGRKERVRAVVRKQRGKKKTHLRVQERFRANKASWAAQAITSRCRGWYVEAFGRCSAFLWRFVSARKARLP